MTALLKKEIQQGPENLKEVLEEDPENEFARLENLYGHLQGLELLDRMINHELRGRIALVSSFGAESVILLHMVAQVNKATPVIFLNTQKLFGETLKYRDQIVKQLGLSNLITILPDADDVEREDRNGLLWARDTDACCDLRKVRPLAQAMNGYQAWITGRKRFQSSSRASIPLIERDGATIKLNPLALWDEETIEQKIKTIGLPPHPLVAEGYPSIGCMPCTARVELGQDKRSGRWAGAEKTECGIHLGENI